MRHPTIAQLETTIAGMLDDSGTSRRNRTRAGYWRAIAEAAEALAGASTTANSSVLGYMKRTADALEVITGVNNIRNPNAQGYLERMVMSFEALGSVTAGSINARLAAGAAAAVFTSEPLPALVATLTGSAKSETWDVTDMSTLFQGTDESTPAGENELVRRVNAKANSNILFATGGAARPRAMDGLTFVAGDDLEYAFPGGAGSSDMCIVFVYKGTDTQGIFCEFGDTVLFAGTYQSGSAAASHFGVSAPSTEVDGAAIATTRAALFTAACDGDAHVIAIDDLDLSGVGTVGFSNYGGAGFDVQGILIPVAVVDKTNTTGGKAAAIAWAEQLIEDLAL